MTHRSDRGDLKDLRRRFATVALIGVAVVIAALVMPGSQLIMVEFGVGITGVGVLLFGLEHTSIKANRGRIETGEVRDSP